MAYPYRPITVRSAGNRATGAEGARSGARTRPRTLDAHTPGQDSGPAGPGHPHRRGPATGQRPTHMSPTRPVATATEHQRGDRMRKSRGLTDARPSEGSGDAEPGIPQPASRPNGRFRHRRKRRALGLVAAVLTGGTAVGTPVAANGAAATTTAHARVGDLEGGVQVRQRRLWRIGCPARWPTRCASMTARRRSGSTTVRPAPRAPPCAYGVRLGQRREGDRARRAAVGREEDHRNLTAREKSSPPP